MDNCVIDWGNSAIKVGHFRQGALVNKWQARTSLEAAEKLSSIGLGQVIISSVADEAEQLVPAIRQAKQIIFLDHHTPLPFRNHYKTRETLGKDRVAAISGAVSLYKEEACLVIDIGTCLTYDFVDSDRNYYGGLISPGISLRYRAMHEFTKRLPLIDQSAPTDGFEGTSTEAGMVNGVMQGMSAEINGIIDQYRYKKGELRVVLCGGGVNRFESMLKAPIFVAPELVLIGLNAILEHNEM